MQLFAWLLYAWVFALGAVIGSFLNVCIYRLPLEKSIIWPGSRCGHCYQPIRWFDNIPLLSYVLLRGKCRACGAKFSARYFFIELLTGAGFVTLFHFEFVENIHGFDAGILDAERFLWGRVAVFAFHAALFSFLMVATFCDFDGHVIPLSLTLTGTLVGLLGSVLWPWPWPYTPAEALPLGNNMDWRFRSFREGVYPWPVCGPLPDWLAPGGNWQTGLATGLAGAFVGTMVLRAIRFLFGLGRGAEFTEPEDPVRAAMPRGWIGRAWSWLGRVGGRALGLGDADLMMMAGSFLGWQMVLVAFFVGVLPGLVMGVAQRVLRGNQPFPFGPALAAGVVITWLCWSPIVDGFAIQPFFFDGTLILILTVMCCVFMLVAGYILRLMHLMRS